MPIDRQKLVNAAHRLLNSRAEAEDAVHDALIRAFDTYLDWRIPEPAWIYTVLRNIAIDRRRRQRMEARHTDREFTEGLSLGSSEIASECAAAIRHLLSRVSAWEAAAILLRDVFEFDYRDIAELLDKSESATRQILHRARLRAHGVEPQFDADESYLRLCCQSIEARQPVLLMQLLQSTTAHAQTHATPVGCTTGARSVSMLVQIHGHYAVALILDGVVLCIVPVGTSSPSALLQSTSS